jgi:hypothetical protein
VQAEPAREGLLLLQSRAGELCTPGQLLDALRRDAEELLAAGVELLLELVEVELRQAVEMLLADPEAPGQRGVAGELLPVVGSVALAQRARPGGRRGLEAREQRAAALVDGLCLHQLLDLGARLRVDVVVGLLDAGLHAPDQRMDRVAPRVALELQQPRGLLPPVEVAGARLDDGWQVVQDELADPLEPRSQAAAPGSLAREAVPVETELLDARLTARPALAPPVQRTSHVRREGRHTGLGLRPELGRGGRTQRRHLPVPACRERVAQRVDLEAVGQRPEVIRRRGRSTVHAGAADEPPPRGMQQAGQLSELPAVLEMRDDGARGPDQTRF